MAADDLFHLPLLANFTAAEIAAEHKRRTEARPDRKTYMRDYMRKRRMTA